MFVSNKITDLHLYVAFSLGIKIEIKEIKSVSNKATTQSYINKPYALYMKWNNE
jgi:hypothetical protein